MEEKRKTEYSEPPRPVLGEQSGHDRQPSRLANLMKNMHKRGAFDLKGDPLRKAIKEAMHETKPEWSHHD
jgi:hypothetical protein